MSQFTEDALSHAREYDRLFADRGQGELARRAVHAAKRGVKLPRAREHRDDRSPGDTALANRMEVCLRVAG